MNGTDPHGDASLRTPDWPFDNPLGYDFYNPSGYNVGDPGDRGTCPDSTQGRDGHGWLVVFTDVIMLLLAFFVLVFAMQGVEYNRWQVTVDSLTRSLNPRPEDPTLPTAVRRVERTGETEGADLDYLRAILAESLHTLPHLTGIGLHRDGARLIVTLPTADLFADDDGLAAEGRRRVAAIAAILRHLDNAVGVIGVMGADAGGAVTGDEAIGAVRWTGLLRQADAVAAALAEGGYRRPVDVLARWSGTDRDRIEIAVLASETSR